MRIQRLGPISTQLEAYEHVRAHGKHSHVNKCINEMRVVQFKTSGSTNILSLNILLIIELDSPTDFFFLHSTNLFSGSCHSSGYLYHICRAKKLKIILS